MRKLLILVALIGLAGSALAQDDMKATRVKPDQLTIVSTTRVARALLLYSR